MQAQWRLKVLLAFTLLGVSGIDSVAVADSVEYASAQRGKAAVGHYARARTMCVESLQEFEAGRKYARPDLLIDSEQWRLNMVSLCEQLNRVIDPKVKIDRGGIRVSASPRLIKRARKQLPELVDGPKDRNDYGEQELASKKAQEQLEEESSDQRARLAVKKEIEKEEIKEETVKEPIGQPLVDAKQSADIADNVKQLKKEQAATEEDESVSSDAELDNIQSTAKQISKEKMVEEDKNKLDPNRSATEDSESGSDNSQAIKDALTLPTAKKSAVENAGNVDSEESAEPIAEKSSNVAPEDQQIANAIEDAIQKRIKQLEAGSAKDQAREEE
jgi:hypothetical protein